MAASQGADAGTVTRGERVLGACRAMAAAPAAACGRAGGEGGGGRRRGGRAEARGGLGGSSGGGEVVVGLAGEASVVAGGVGRVGVRGGLLVLLLLQKLLLPLLPRLLLRRRWQLRLLLPLVLLWHPQFGTAATAKAAKAWAKSGAAEGAAAAAGIGSGGCGREGDSCGAAESGAGWGLKNMTVGAGPVVEGKAGAGPLASAPKNDAGAGCGRGAAHGSAGWRAAG